MVSQYSIESVQAVLANTYYKAESFPLIICTPSCFTKSNVVPEALPPPHVKIKSAAADAMLTTERTTKMSVSF